jgi:hypothetical protein
MEIGIAVAVFALWIGGSLIPTGHTVPQEVATLKRGLRFDLPYTNEMPRMISRLRLLARWRVEHVSSDAVALAQHFEIHRNGSC